MRSLPGWIAGACPVPEAPSPKWTGWLSVFALCAVLWGGAAAMAATAQGGLRLDVINERLNEHLRVSQLEIANLRSVEASMRLLELEAKTRMTALETIAESNARLLTGLVLGIAALVVKEVVAFFAALRRKTA